MSLGNNKRSSRPVGRGQPINRAPSIDSRPSVEQTRQDSPRAVAQSGNALPTRLHPNSEITGALHSAIETPKKPLPPHLRKVTPTSERSMPYKHTSTITTPAVQSTTPLVVVSTTSQPTQTGTNSVLQGVNIVFQAPMSTFRARQNGIVRLHGHIFLFWHPHQRIALWEAQLENGELKRGDIRSISSVFKNLSTIMIRIKGHMTPASEFAPQEYKLENIAQVNNLDDCIKKMEKEADPTEPEFPLTKGTSQKIGVLDVSTLKPHRTMVDENVHMGKQSRPTTKTEPQKPEPATNEEHQQPKLPTKKELQQSEPVTKKDHQQANVARSEDVLGDMIRDLAQKDARDEIKATQQETQQITQPAAQQTSWRMHGQNEVEAAPAMLIDTSLSPSKPNNTPVSTKPHANDLEGIVYEPAGVECGQIGLPKAPHDDVTTSALHSESKTGPAAAQNSDGGLKGTHTINVKNILRIPVGVDLSEGSKRVLSKIGVHHYRDMSRGSDDLARSLRKTHMVPDESIRDSAGILAVVSYLTRKRLFECLSPAEQLKTAAVVFHNLHQVQTRARISYTPERLLESRQDALPPSSAIHMFNILIRLRDNQATGRLSRPATPANVVGGSLHIPQGAGESDTETPNYHSGHNDQTPTRPVMSESSYARRTPPHLRSGRGGISRARWE